MRLAFQRQDPRTVIGRGKCRSSASNRLTVLSPTFRRVATSWSVKSYRPSESAGNNHSVNQRPCRTGPVSTGLALGKNGRRRRGGFPGQEDGDITVVNGSASQTTRRPNLWARSFRAVSAAPGFSWGRRRRRPVEAGPGRASWREGAGAVWPAATSARPLWTSRIDPRQASGPARRLTYGSAAGASSWPVAARPLPPAPSARLPRPVARPFHRPSASVGAARRSRRWRPGSRNKSRRRPAEAGPWPPVALVCASSTRPQRGQDDGGSLVVRILAPSL
jgi:hypothetical protein